MTSCLKEAIMEEIDNKGLPRWMEKMMQYLKKRELLENVVEAKTIKRQVAEYLVLGGVLYREGRTYPCLRCLTLEEVKKVLENIHAGYVSHKGRVII